MREVYSRKPSVNFPVVLNRSVKVGAESYQRGVGSHAALQFKGAALEQGKFALGGIGAAAINVVNHSERYPRRGLEPRSVCQKRGGTNVGVIAARIDKNRALLMAALRVHRAEDTIKSSNIMQSWLEEMIAAKTPNSAASFKWPTFNAPVYQANVSNIGLLGASLGADVVSVMTRTGIIDPPATIDRPMSNEVVAKLYAGLENAMREWREDLCHVALRIRAREEGTLDPGTLLEAQIKRKQEKGQDERDIAASTPGIPRTKRQQEKVKKERIDE
jgi:hypothetical protein